MKASGVAFYNFKPSIRQLGWIPSWKNVASLDNIQSSEHKGERSVKLLRDNARPRTASTTKDTIISLVWDSQQFLQQPAYSLDATLSNYDLFRSIQHILSDTQFQLLIRYKKNGSMTGFCLLGEKIWHFTVTEFIFFLIFRWLKGIERTYYGEYFEFHWTIWIIRLYT